MTVSLSSGTTRSPSSTASTPAPSARSPTPQRTADLANAFRSLDATPTVALSTTNAGAILGVTNGHVATVADFNAVTGSCNTGQQSPMIFDSNGSLFSQLVGDASVIGFTSPCNLSRTDTS